LAQCFLVSQVPFQHREPGAQSLSEPQGLQRFPMHSCPDGHWERFWQNPGILSQRPLAQAKPSLQSVDERHCWHLPATQNSFLAAQFLSVSQLG
jgi:hypothetical protein